jgi:hypothetical protein
MAMATKLSGKNRRALLQGIQNLKAESPLSNAVPQKQVLDRRAAKEQRKFARNAQTQWLYKPTDLVVVKDYRWGIFNATIMSVEGGWATVLGPMGTAVVACNSIRLIDRYDD